MTLRIIAFFIIMSKILIFLALGSVINEKLVYFLCYISLRFWIDRLRLDELIKFSIRHDYKLSLNIVVNLPM